ncbi:MAG: hypothetical protein IKO35_02735 [Elusimicrobiaceae bacterium]|nr:hypothetical protein [Elusimicrobiaceae bacterium]
MSKCCKYAKWFPHNWLCLKGLSIVFLVLFYLTLIHTVYQTISIVTYPAWPNASTMWKVLTFYVLSELGVALGFLTLNKVLTALRKIKQAVAPCCCEGHTEETHSEETTK